jgi:hypothetical protein
MEGVGERVGADETAHETIVVANEEETETSEEGHAVEKRIVLEANHGGGGGLGGANTVGVVLCFWSDPVRPEEERWSRGCPAYSGMGRRHTNYQEVEWQWSGRED